MASSSSPVSSVMKCTFCDTALSTGTTAIHKRTVEAAVLCSEVNDPLCCSSCERDLLRRQAQFAVLKQFDCLVCEGDVCTSNYERDASQARTTTRVKLPDATKVHRLLTELKEHDVPVRYQQPDCDLGRWLCWRCYSRIRRVPRDPSAPPRKSGRPKKKRKKGTASSEETNEDSLMAPAVPAGRVSLGAPIGTADMAGAAVASDRTSWVHANNGDLTRLSTSTRPKDFGSSVGDAVKLTASAEPLMTAVRGTLPPLAIVSRQFLNRVTSTALCPCGQGMANLCNASQRGAQLVLSYVCVHCGDQFRSYTVPNLDHTTVRSAPAVDVLMSYAALADGTTMEKQSKYFNSLGILVPDQRTLYRHQQTLVSKVESLLDVVCEENLMKLITEKRSGVDVDKVVQVDVAWDGSWDRGRNGSHCVLIVLARVGGEVRIIGWVVVSKEHTRTLKDGRKVVITPGIDISSRNMESKAQHILLDTATSRFAQLLEQHKITLRVAADGDVGLVQLMKSHSHLMSAIIRDLFHAGKNMRKKLEKRHLERYMTALTQWLNILACKGTLSVSAFLLRWCNAANHFAGDHDSCEPESKCKSDPDFTLSEDLKLQANEVQQFVRVLGEILPVANYSVGDISESIVEGWFRVKLMQVGKDGSVHWNSFKARVALGFLRQDRGILQAEVMARTKCGVPPLDAHQTKLILRNKSKRSGSARRGVDRSEPRWSKPAQETKAADVGLQPYGASDVETAQANEEVARATGAVYKECKVWQCTHDLVCKKNKHPYKGYDSYKNHMETHHKTDLDNGVAVLLGKDESSVVSVKARVRSSKEGEEEKPSYTCPGAPSASSSSSSTDKLCMAAGGKKYVQYKAYVKHMDEFHASAEVLEAPGATQFPCSVPDCPAAFKSAEEHNDHIGAKHGGAAHYLIAECQGVLAAFETLQTLKRAGRASAAELDEQRLQGVYALHRDNLEPRITPTSTATAPASPKGARMKANIDVTIPWKPV